MKDRNVTVKKGVGFLELLSILFIGLKIPGIITWSWWLVLSPILIPWAIALILIVMLGIGTVIKNIK